MRLAIAAACAGAALPAQEKPGPDTPAQPEPGKYVLIDRVEAKVGDDAILRSRIVAQITDDVRVREMDLGRPLTANEYQTMFLLARQRFENQYALAQAAKTLGILPPEQIEAILNQQVANAEAEQVRQFDTYTKFAQALSRTGRTWDDWLRETRMQEALKLTNQLAVYGRLQNQEHLFITPRMLRELYDELKPGLFVFGPRASFDVVKVDAGGDAGQAATVAAAAAEQWRKTGGGGRELVATVQQQQRDAHRRPDVIAFAQTWRVASEGTNPPLPQPLIDFALQHAQGEVSDPIPHDGDLWLVRVVDKVEGRNAAFDAPEVQIELRNRLRNYLLNHLDAVAIQRARDRTHVWRVEDR